MDPIYSQFVNMYVFQLGRRVFVCREVARRAEEIGAADIRELADRSVVHDSALYAKRQNRLQMGENVYGPEAGVADNNLDHGIVGHYTHLDGIARMFRGSPVGDAAAEMRDGLYPSGPGAITRLPYAAQHSAVEDIFRVIAEPDMAQIGAQIPHFAEMTSRLRTLHEAYGAALHKYANVSSRAEIRAENAVGQNNLAALVILILAHGLRNEPQAAEQRDYMLEPIVRQNEAIRRSRRQRNPVGDVDPDTGVELPTSPGDERPTGELPGDFPNELPGDDSGDGGPVGELPENDAPGDELPGTNGGPEANENSTRQADAASANRRRAG